MYIVHFTHSKKENDNLLHIFCIVGHRLIDGYLTALNFCNNFLGRTPLFVAEVASYILRIYIFKFLENYISLKHQRLEKKLRYKELLLKKKANEELILQKIQLQKVALENKKKPNSIYLRPTEKQY